MIIYRLIDQSESGEVSLDALRQNGISGLEEGEKISLKDLSQLALIGSSNDAAYALASSVGSYLGSNNATAQFVAGMNIRAEELQLDSLEFKNPTGLDLSPTEPGAVGSARDVSLLLAHIVSNYPKYTSHFETPGYPSGQIWGTIPPLSPPYPPLILGVLQN